MFVKKTQNFKEILDIAILPKRNMVPFKTIIWNDWPQKKLKEKIEREN